MLDWLGLRSQPHGVKLITFRFLQVPKSVLWTWTDQGNAEGCAGWTGGWWGGTASAQSSPSTTTRSPDNQRPRRRTRVQGSTRTSKPEDARTGAGENAGRTRHARPAGETAGAGTASAQSPFQIQFARRGGETPGNAGVQYKRASGVASQII